MTVLAVPRLAVRSARRPTIPTATMTIAINTSTRVKPRSVRARGLKPRLPLSWVRPEDGLGDQVLAFSFSTAPGAAPPARARKRARRAELERPGDRTRNGDP